MLREPGRLPEGHGSVLVILKRIICPGFGFQRVDNVVPGHDIDVAAAKGIAELFVLRFRVKAYDTFSGLTDVGQQEFHQIALALAGVAQNKDIGICFVLRPMIKVHNHIAAELVLPDIQPMGIRLAAEVDGIQIRYGVGR